MQVGTLLLPIRISQRGKAMDQVKRVLYVHDRSIESDAANSHTGAKDVPGDSRQRVRPDARGARI